MGYLIEISEQKKEKLSEHIEKALHELGKAMACVEQFGGEYGQRDGSYGNRYDDEMGMRGDYGSRGNYGSRMGYRDDDDDEMMWGERRGVRGSGRGRR